MVDLVPGFLHINILAVRLVTRSSLFLYEYQPSSCWLRIQFNESQSQIISVLPDMASIGAVGLYW